jgi:hypothetical protein
VNKLPFIKKFGYQDECEFRIVYESKDLKLASKDIPISLTSIERITLNPWMTQKLSSSLRETIRSIENCETLTITRSTLVGNTEWKEFADKARVLLRRRKTINIET